MNVQKSFTPNEINVYSKKFIRELYVGQLKKTSSADLFTSLKKDSVDFQDSPIFVYSILSTLARSREEKNLNYFIKNISQDHFASCVNGLLFTLKKGGKQMALPPLIFYAIFPRTIVSSRLNPKIINILFAHDKIDINTPINRDFSYSPLPAIDNFLIMDGASPLDMVIEKTRNIPIAQALFLHGTQLKLIPSKSGLKFYKSIINTLSNLYKWLILSRFDPQSHLNIFPKEILYKIVQYQILNAKERFLPEDGSFIEMPTPYLIALDKLKYAMLRDNPSFGRGKVEIEETKSRDLDILFRQVASDPNYINTLKCMIINARDLDIDIHASNEESENGLDMAIKHHNQQAIILLKEANIVTNLHQSNSKENCGVQL